MARILYLTVLKVVTDKVSKFIAAAYLPGHRLLLAPALLLVLLLAGCGSVTPKPVSPPPAPVVPAPIPITVTPASGLAGLTLEEYFLTTDKVLGQMGAEYLQGLPAMRAQRQAWRGASPQTAALINRELQGTDYVVKYFERDKTPVLDLYKWSQPIAADLTGPITISRSASGKRFLLTVGGTALADENGAVAPERFQAETPLRQAPVMVGEDVVWLQWDQPTQSIQVLRNGQLEFSSPFGRTLASYDYAAQGLSVWDGKWVLETWDDQVIIDGQSLNRQLGYDKIFAFRMLAGKPFFFFSQNGKVQIFYGGEVLPIEYEAVAHRGCCDTYWTNPVGSDVMISFYAMRDSAWHYVDLGRYN